MEESFFDISITFVGLNRIIRALSPKDALIYMLNNNNNFLVEEWDKDCFKITELRKKKGQLK